MEIQISLTFTSKHFSLVYLDFFQSKKFLQVLCLAHFHSNIYAAAAVMVEAAVVAATTAMMRLNAVATIIRHHGCL